jgi:Tol biopolymer transport system component
MDQDVFVSYSSKDKAVADAVVTSLEMNGIRCWYAPRDIEPSDDWGRAISSAIENSRVFLLIFSDNSNRSQRVLDELNVAISQELTILPFRIENLEPDGAMRLHLSSRHWLDAYDPSWDKYIKELVITVSSSLASSISSEEIEVPEQLRRKQTTHNLKRATRIISGLIAAGFLFIAIWYGVSRAGLFNQEEQKPEFTPTTEPAATIESSPEAISEPCKIAFFSHREAGQNIWVMEPDGSNQSQVTFNKYDDNFISWSPDGEQVVFRSYRDGDAEIFIMNADGTNIRQLTDNESCDRGPKWSPQGDKIAFFSDRSDSFQVYSMAIDGSNIQQLTTDHGVYGEPAWPFLDWSPDGGQIAFTSDRDGDMEIFVMNADGSEIRQLTFNDGFEAAPDWSPDGQQIAFSSDRYGDEEIFVMDPFGENIRQLTSNKSISANPDWSPDGSKIVFISDRDGDFEVWIMDADGGNQTQLTFNDAPEYFPQWSPVCELSVLENDSAEIE